MYDTTRADARSGATGVIIALAWFASYVGARWGLEIVERGSTAAVLLALMPVVPFVAVLWFVIGGIRGTDELERRIHLEALAVAFPLTVLLLMVLGLLDLAVELNPADWSYRHIWPFTVLFWVAGLALARRRYA